LRGGEDEREAEQEGEAESSELPPTLYVAAGRGQLWGATHSSACSLSIFLPEHAGPAVRSAWRLCVCRVAILGPRTWQLAGRGEGGLKLWLAGLIGRLVWRSCMPCFRGVCPLEPGKAHVELERDLATIRVSITCLLCCGVGIGAAAIEHISRGARPGRRLGLGLVASCLATLASCVACFRNKR